MSKIKEPTYEDLKKTLDDAEIAESFVFRSTISTDEKKLAEEEFRKLRMERLKQMSDEELLQSGLMRMRLLMQDYFKQNNFIEEFSFAKQLKDYLGLLKKSNVAFAKDLNIHRTKLSRILNKRENPNIDLMYRLEHHSGDILPANYWYRLHTIEIEETIKKDKNKRAAALKHVKNELSFKRSA